MQTRHTHRRGLLLALLLLPAAAWAQDQAEVDPGKVEAPPEAQKPKEDLSPAGNAIAGEFTPSKGFDLLKSDWGSLNISMYGLFRYVNQLPAQQTFTDHLGRERVIKTRNDLNWHRTMVWFSGFALNPRFIYVVTLWSLPSTQQTLLFGNMQYRFNRALTLGVGIGPNLTARSMSGSHPFWLSSDRVMGEEFFRGGFSSGAWLKGELLPRFFYTVSVNTNLSQLGITASNDTRDLAFSGTFWWMPTTGEFGQRGGMADFEEHPRLATRFGMSAGHAREDRASQLGLAPNATQIRISDGLLLFEEGALADGVTVQKGTYQDWAIDAAMKYRGFTLQAEYFFRWLNDFVATGPLPIDEIFDHGFTVQAMHMLLPKKLGLYGSASYVFDDFQRHPWEVLGGLSYFPFDARSVRLNLHVIHVEKSPTGSSFGFYTGGQTGTTLSLGVDILL
ncbi:hypothetical protein FGE12_11890 [Aggregicoccus sp. 17bor-14]|uniref:hypothetical protein n=1 Tax=Myxococcaceae TaxID=31 RepID=UPI00129C2DFF|nr:MULTISPECIES: hypothetical protein [Myxococcaceae]MBF5043090.1 hypothetical protein [Simulacricoccus sp. 17bor-14]MRI88853.1 hypothetical protein [Aggregicoccus sp. 17bor-14]